MLLVQGLAASQGSAGDSVGKGLWLGLRSGRSSQGGLSLGGGGGGGQELNLLADSTAEVGEGLIDISRVVIGFGRVLVADRAGNNSAKVPGLKEMQ